MMALHAYPQIPMASRSPGRRSSLTSQLANEPKETLNGAIPDPSVNDEKRKKRRVNML
jgi:hypothetical protein